MTDSSVTPWTTARQAALSMRLPRQEHRNGLHFLFQKIFLTQGSNLHLLPHFLNCRQILYHWATWEIVNMIVLLEAYNGSKKSFIQTMQSIQQETSFKKKSMFMISSAIITKYNCYIWNRFPDFRNLPTRYSFYFCSIPIFLACKKRCQKSCLDILKCIFAF